MTKHQQTTHVYRFVAVGFGALALLLFGVIIYVAYASAIITITLTPKPVETTFSLTVAQGGENGALKGLYLTTTVSGQKPLSTTGATPGNTKARGTVKLVNKTTSNQPLVATTRLLSKEGVLFRTTTRVVVPGNGSVDVDVVADQAGATGAIGPSTFTLPGLRAANQAVIYGKSSNAMAGGTAAETSNPSPDKEKVQADLTSTLVSQATDFLQQTLTKQGLAYKLQVVGQDATTQTSANASSVSVKVTLAALATEADSLAARAQEELQKAASAGETVIPVDPKDIQLSISSSNAQTQSAVVAVRATSSAWLDSTSSQFAASRFARKSKDDIAALGRNAPGIKKIEAVISPVWASRTPKNTSRIQVSVIHQP